MRRKQGKTQPHGMSEPGREKNMTQGSIVMVQRDDPLHDDNVSLHIIGTGGITIDNNVNVDWMPGGRS